MASDEEVSVEYHVNN